MKNLPFPQNPPLDLQKTSGEELCCERQFIEKAHNSFVCVAKRRVYHQSILIYICDCVYEQ